MNFISWLFFLRTTGELWNQAIIRLPNWTKEEENQMTVCTKEHFSVLQETSMRIEFWFNTMFTKGSTFWFNCFREECLIYHWYVPFFSHTHGDSKGMYTCRYGFPLPHALCEKEQLSFCYSLPYFAHIPIIVSYTHQDKLYITYRNFNWSRMANLWLSSP